MGITHILNAAEGEWNSVDTGAEYYRDMDVHYYGITAEDVPTFNLSQYFYSAAEHMHQTLRNPQSELKHNSYYSRANQHADSQYLDTFD